MKPNLFTYDDYRIYLKDSYRFLKETRKAFSFRYFSREAGFASSNFLQLVMSGKRNLSPHSIPKFAKALKLNQQETEFFENLVMFNQASTSAEKSRHYQKMIHSRRYREINQLAPSQFEYFSHWYYAAVRELVELPGFQEDSHWIAGQVSPAITKAQAQKALRLLQRLNMLKRGSDGKLEQVDRTITSGPEVRSVAVKNFHREALALASDALDHVPPAERDVSGAMFSVPEARIVEIKEKIQHFRKALLASVAGYPEPADRVYQLNLQLFPVTKGKKE
jgi:uncharacterized protein (TIGR02147 family)